MILSASDFTDSKQRTVLIMSLMKFLHLRNIEQVNLFKLCFRPSAIWIILLKIYYGTLFPALFKEFHHVGASVAPLAEHLRAETPVGIHSSSDELDLLEVLQRVDVVALRGRFQQGCLGYRAVLPTELVPELCSILEISKFVGPRPSTIQFVERLPHLFVADPASTFL